MGDSAQKVEVQNIVGSLSINEIQDKLTDIWAAELKIQPDEVDINEHFVNMGGYSLLVIILVDKMNKEFNLNLQLDVVIEKPSVLELSQYILELLNLSYQGQTKTKKISDEKDNAESLTVITKPEEQYHSFPLTELQQAYWIGEKNVFEHGGPAFFYEEYHAEKLDIDRFTIAVNMVIKKHPALRTIVLESGEQKVLEVIPEFEVKYFDFSSDDKAKLKIEKNAKWLKANPLTSSEWPLFDFYIFKENSKYTVQMVGRLLVFDGVSWQIFASDLLAFYEDPSLDLSEPELTFRDYVNTIEDYKKNSKEYKKSLNYWKERVRTLPEAPQLPRTRNDSIAQDSNILTRRKYVLESDKWKKLKSIAKDKKLTPTVVICAAFCDVLAAWCKVPNFTLNMMYGNRQPIHPDVNKILGNFSTTLLLEINSNNHESFSVRANEIQNRLFKDLEHGIVSGVRVIREINSQSQSGVSPAMPIVFSSSLGGVQEDREFYFLEKLGWSRVEGKLKTPQVVFDHQVFVTNGELILNWDTEDCEFPEGMLDDMFSSYTGMINALCDDENLWDSKSRSLIPEKQLKLRYDVNKTDSSISEDLLYTGFLDSVKKYPDNIAVISNDKNFTYKEIYEYAIRISREIIRNNATKGDIVAVIQEKGWGQIVSVLGVLMAGCTYLPLTTSIPEKRIDYILELCDVKIVLSKDQKYISENKTNPVRNILVSKININQPAKFDFIKNQSASDLAYIIFTSGSTGLPKGVMIDHKGAVNTIHDINKRFSINEMDKILAVSELNFDLSVYDVFGTLAVGATIIIPDHSDKVEPQHLADLVRRYEITVWNSVPAYVEMEVEYLSDKKEQYLKSLRLILMSGDWIPVSLPEKLNSINANIEIISLGGATEASIWSNYYIVDDVNAHTSSIPYGYPLTNQRMYVFDKNFEFRPNWVPGEIYIAGIGLAKGYFADEEKTKSSFIKSPQTGERLYKTGDWGRYLQNGAIEFLGREDSQIKIRGYRIELGEIESVLAEFEELKEVVVLAIGDKSSALHLVAYYTCDEDDALNVTKLKDYAGKKLPSYMIPVDFVHLDSLPLTNNGKVNRKGLQDQYKGRDRNESDFNEKINITEHKLLKIWKGLLKVDYLTIHDDFFAMGGHSIMAVQMVNKIDKEFEKQIPLSILYERGDIRSLAHYLDSLESDEWSSLVTINKTGSLPPIFFIHPIGGNVLCYAALADLLSNELPMYGLQSFGLNKNVVAHETVREMAEHYVDIIQKTIDGNVCKIIGWSMGGVIGYEVTRQLNVLGVNVQLVMIDSWLSKLDGSNFDYDEVNLAFGFFNDFCQGQLDEKQFSGWVADNPDVLEIALSKLKANKRIPESISLSEIKSLFNVYKTNTFALWNYQPEHLNLPISLLVAKGNKKDMFVNLISAEEKNKKTALANDINIEYLDGDHYSIFDKNNINNLVQATKKAFL